MFQVHIPVLFALLSIKILKALGKVQMQNIMISIHPMPPSSPARATEDGDVEDSDAFISGYDKKQIP